jgi:hypothetical protein
MSIEAEFNEWAKQNRHLFSSYPLTANAAPFYFELWKGGRDAALAAPAEPVAWRIKRIDGTYAYGDGSPLLADGDEYKCEPLYTTPPAPEAPKCPNAALGRVCGGMLAQGAAPEAQTDEAKDSNPQPGETWHIARPGATALDTQTVIAVTPLTVRFKPAVYGFDGELVERSRVRFVERAASTPSEQP